jgi:hypothetical protein
MEVNDAYSMLLGRPRLIDAKVNHDWRNNMVPIRGNGTVKTIYVSQRKGPKPKLLEVLVCYNFPKGLTDEEEDRFLTSEADIFAVGIMTLPQLDLAGALISAEGDPMPLLQQTQDVGLGHVV